MGKKKGNGSENTETSGCKFIFSKCGKCILAKLCKFSGLVGKIFIGGVIFMAIWGIL
ncbi:hypothetical protein AGMMS50230_02170 [Spirochaetia bacterium]|nr:hypothetical protein AGMMS50230_02170 [Spirochaetia bacterium]